MRPTIVFTTLAIASSLAFADPFAAATLPQRLADLTAGSSREGELQGTPPRFAFNDSEAKISQDDFLYTKVHLGDYGTPRAGAVIGRSADGKAAWIAVDVEYESACGMEGCDKVRWPRAHVSGVFDASGHAVAWHVGTVFAGSGPFFGTRRRVASPPEVPDGIDPGAGEVAKLFQASIADPVALAKTVSDRKDAVLLGSEEAEHYVGGAKVRAQLVRWNLGFTVRDGIQAGVAPSGTVAWVAANVDAAKKGSKTTTPYRVSAIYAKTAAGWQLVVLHFSSAYEG